MSTIPEHLLQQGREAIPRAREVAMRDRGVDKVTVVPGEEAFKLQSTHGLPIEVQIDAFAERGALVDLRDYWEHMEEHRAKSRAGNKLQGLRTKKG